MFEKCWISVHFAHSPTIFRWFDVYTTKCLPPLKCRIFLLYLCYFVIIEIITLFLQPEWRTRIRKRESKIYADKCENYVYVQHSARENGRKIFPYFIEQTSRWSGVVCAAVAIVAWFFISFPPSAQNGEDVYIYMHLLCVRK